MTSSVAGDPASVSALAAELHRVSSALTSVRGALASVHQDLDRRSGGAAADGAGRELQAAASRAATTTGALEECRRALQSYAADLQEARAQALVAGAVEAGVAARTARDDAEDAARRLAARVAAAVDVLGRVARVARVARFAG